MESPILLIKSVARNVYLDHCQRLVERERVRVLFLIAHMRSGSSLLVHILNTNPEIAGFGETHRTYSDKRDLARLILQVSRSFGRLRLHASYYLDKLVFDYIRDLRLLQEVAVRTVFLVRRPEHALPSLVRFRRGVTNHAPGEPAFERWTEDTALSHYVGRLERMQEYAEGIGDPERAFLLTYEGLLADTAGSLARLTRFLGLRHPLTENYDKIWSTGVRRIGDDSANIRCGRVVSDSPAECEAVSPAILEPARRAHSRCVEVLASWCDHAPSSTDCFTSLSRHR